MIARTYVSYSSPLARTALAVLAFGIISTIATVAHAAVPADDMARVEVNYSALDLKDEQGAMALYKRIVSAARKVCPAASGPSLGAMRATERCVAEAVSRAVRDVDSPQLAKLDSMRSRGQS